MLQAAVVALLAALGLAAGGALSDEERRRRQRSVEGAPSGPAAGSAPESGTGTGTQTQTGTQAGTQTQTRTACKRCPPDCGQMGPVSHSMSEGPRLYQARITGFPPGFEWKYMGLDFDGFVSAECLLLEAKGNYDQFLSLDGGQIVYKYFFHRKIFTDMGQQVIRQFEVVVESPPARCHWHFQTPIAFQLMHQVILRFSPILQAYHTP